MIGGVNISGVANAMQERRRNKVFGIVDSGALGEIYKMWILDDTSTRLESN